MMAEFTGSAGDDTITGTSGNDDFHLEQGGEDRATGGSGFDIFYLGASFDPGDSINGGSGEDHLELAGDYSSGFVFQSTTMVDVEHIDLTAGFSYDFSGFSQASALGLTVDAHTLGAEDHFAFDASGVANASVTLLGGAGANDLTGGTRGDSLVGGDGDDVIHGGMGDDTIRAGDGSDSLGGGEGRDQIHFGAGVDTVYGADGNDYLIASSSINSRDQLNGGADYDTLELLAGDFVLSGHVLSNIEAIGAEGVVSIKIKDSLVPAGATMSLDTWGGTLNFNANKEADGAFDITLRGVDNVVIGGGGNDSILGADGHEKLSGGGGDDYIRGGNDLSSTINGGAGDDDIANQGWGPDLLNGGGGNDEIFAYSHNDTAMGGAGDDLIHFITSDSVIGGTGADTLEGPTSHSAASLIYTSVKDSNALAADFILNLDNDDIIDLSQIDADKATSGDQAFHLVSQFGGHVGELVVSYDSIRGITSVSGDVNGDGVADLVITIDGQHADFSNFVF